MTAATSASGSVSRGLDVDAELLAELLAQACNGSGAPAHRGGAAAAGVSTSDPGKGISGQVALARRSRHTTAAADGPCPSTR